MRTVNPKLLNPGVTGNHWRISNASDKMVTFQEYMSVALNKCGNDPETFSELVDLWNSETDQIRGMTKKQVKQNLTCP